MANERDNKPVPAQSLHMLNSSHIQRKLEQGPAMKAILGSGRPPAEIVEKLYLTILSRRPTQEELKIVAEFAKSAPSRRDAAIDVAWALINSPEFLYRHWSPFAPRKNAAFAERKATVRKATIEGT
jgi:hypothetical protein